MFAGLLLTDSISHVRDWRSGMLVTCPTPMPPPVEVRPVHLDELVGAAQPVLGTHDESLGADRVTTGQQEELFRPRVGESDDGIVLLCDGRDVMGDAVGEEGRVAGLDEVPQIVEWAAQELRCPRGIPIREGKDHDGVAQLGTQPLAPTAEDLDR